MDLIIAIKEEQAFICNIPTIENADEELHRLELEGAESMDEIFTFKKGSMVIDDSDELHTVADICTSIDLPMTEWYITTSSGAAVNVFDLKGTVIKEVPKYHIDGLLA